MGGVVVFRAVRRRKRIARNPGQDALLWTFLALAIGGATLRLSFLERALAAVTGMRDIAVLPKHLAVMTASLCLVGWVATAVPIGTPEPRWRRLTNAKPRFFLGFVAAAVAIATFPHAAPAPVSADGSLEFINGQWGGDTWGGRFTCSSTSSP